MKTYKDVDAYITAQPKEVREVLTRLRRVVHQTAPRVEESIRYGMPAYKIFWKPLVYFAGQKSHIGFYPTPAPIAAFKKELAGYKQSKGAVQFPFDEPIPAGLIVRMIRCRMDQIQSETGVHTGKNKYTLS